MDGVYTVVISKIAAKAIRRIADRKEQTRLRKQIDRLAKDPRPPGSKKLVGSDNYRVRQGDYRIIYTIQDRELRIEIVRIGHRGGVYR